MKRYIALTCEALARSVYAAAAESPHTVTVQLYRQGLHNTPKNLRATLQEQIDAIQPGACDAILLVYGICGTSTIDLVVRHTPLIMPRTHDCIALYLGSHVRYQAEFDAQPGTYWYSQDYMERNEPGSNVGLGASAIEDNMDNVYEKYVEKYGQDNADYLMEVMGEWSKHYRRAVYIDMGTGNGHAYETLAQQQAERRNWTFERKQGDRRMINMLLNGEWPDDEFLTVPPGHTVRQFGGEGLIRAAKIESDKS
jgi:hypothetical protein